MSPSRVNQRVIWRSGVWPGIDTQRTNEYLGVDARLESSKEVRRRIKLFLHTSIFIMLIILV